MNEDDVRPEIYAYGMRNPQRFGWDPDNGNLFLADIGQNMVEKISLVPRGGNLGWRDWEGSFRFIGQGQITTDNPRHDTEVVYPVAEYTRFDPLMQEKNAEQGRNPADRTDLRFGTGPDNQVFILNKHDGVIRRLTSG